MSGTRDPGVFLEDMIAAAAHLAAVSAAATDEELISEEGSLRGDVRYQLTVFGEAAKHVPPHVRARRPQIAWSRIAGLRDKIVHDYFGLEEALVVEVVRMEIPRDLPLLRAVLEEIEAEARG